LSEAQQHYFFESNRSFSGSTLMSMQRLTKFYVLFAMGALGGAAELGAQTQTVTFAVNAVNQISFAGAPSLTITTAVAGSDPTSVVDAVSATWNVTTNQSNAKVSASIATAMPAGLTLRVLLAAPAGATSLGSNSIGTTSVDLVSGITKQKGVTLNATYELDATAAAGVISSATKVVTYTISGGT
jgi:hypothetical protein